MGCVSLWSSRLSIPCVGEKIAVAAFGELVKGPEKLFESAGHLLLWAELPTQLLKLGRSVVMFGESLADKAFAQAADKAAKVYINTTF